MINSSVKYLKGVGPTLAGKLSLLGINTIEDLLRYYPADYQDRRNIKKINQLVAGEESLVCGTVLTSGVIEAKNNLAIFKSAITDGTSHAWVTVFRRINPFHKFNVFQNYKRDFVKGNKIFVWGYVQENFGEIIITPKEYEVSGEGDGIHSRRITPIYALTAGIKQKWLRKLIFDALERYASDLEEILPNKGNGFLSIAEAVSNIHFPADYETLEKARRTLAYDEFLVYQTALAMSRATCRVKNKTHSYKIRKNLLTPFKKNLNFDFTSSQKKVINEIFNDMLSPSPMNRILIGDVGCGKTVVALSAMLLAAENGYQSVIMAPTEILARQHFDTMNRYLAGLDLKVELLTSSTASNKRNFQKLARAVSSGEANIIVGTHALIEERVEFASAKLIVIDEQHKFGVNQRLKLREKAPESDVLLMSATPIPRTLALTIYGDLDVSFITELPPGRIPVKTFVMKDTEAYEFAKKEMKAGNRAFIVYPLIESSEKLDLKSAVDEANNLAKNVFSEFRIGLIHGKMKPAHKALIMEEFKAGKIDLLISTVVVEVGIDVPSATVLIVEHAERFGLATLHQLRGRVGRGDRQSYCIIVGDPVTADAKFRFKTLVETNDGFEVAKADLKLRGAGEIIGTYQHGEINLKIGDFNKDEDLIEKASRLARQILAEDRRLYKYPVLKQKILRRYGDRIMLAQVG